jgi:DNA-binding response OmpR family regulator
MKTILVVDDEFGIAEALSSTLTDEGYRVFTAANGKQGFAILAEVKPDLVIVDYMMPIWSGDMMIQAMKDDPASAAIPVIMMSAVSEAEMHKITDGYRAYLRKPFDLDALLRCVQKLLGTA